MQFGGGAAYRRDPPEAPTGCRSVGRLRFADLPVDAATFEAPATGVLFALEAPYRM